MHGPTRVVWASLTPCSLKGGRPTKKAIKSLEKKLGSLAQQASKNKQKRLYTIRTDMQLDSDGEVVSSGDESDGHSSGEDEDGDKARGGEGSPGRHCHVGRKTATTSEMSVQLPKK